MRIPTFPGETKYGSFYDEKKKLYTDCSECQKGARGDKSCIAGTNKTKHKGGCYGGIIMGDYENKPKK